MNSRSWAAKAGNVEMSVMRFLFETGWFSATAAGEVSFGFGGMSSGKNKARRGLDPIFNHKGTEAQRRGLKQELRDSGTRQSLDSIFNAEARRITSKEIWFISGQRVFYRKW